MNDAIADGGTRQRRYIPFRALVPNAITLLALCAGLTGVRYAVAERWDAAVLAVVVAAILDALDGRVARLLKAQTRFGAELDSLSDVIAFGVAPAVIVYLWALDRLPGNLGWLVALAHTLAAALRLARFNASLDAADGPRKAAGYLTGIPAPAGAGLLLFPVYGTLAIGADATPVLTAPGPIAVWTAIVAVLMISTVATAGWSVFRPRPAWRPAALLGFALVGAALLAEPWWTLTISGVAYALSVPLAMLSFARHRARHAKAQAAQAR